METKSLFGNYEGRCGEGFWPWPRRRVPSIPAAGCKERANAGHGQKTRRPEGFRAKGRLASLLLGHRPLRVCSLVAPRHPYFCPKTGSPANFKIGSNVVRLMGHHGGTFIMVRRFGRAGILNREKSGFLAVEGVGFQDPSSPLPSPPTAGGEGGKYL